MTIDIDRGIIYLVECIERRIEWIGYTIGSGNWSRLSLVWAVWAFSLFSSFIVMGGFFGEKVGIRFICLSREEARWLR